MEFTFADRLSHFETGIFAALNEKKNQLLAQGRTVYNFSVGTPDFPPAPHILQAVSEAAAQPENYRYSLQDFPELISAVSSYYRRRFHVALSPDEIASVNGSQEGIGHLSLALCNPGDIVLLPNPGYPIFETGAFLADAEIHYYELTAENHFLPDFSSIPEALAHRAKYILVSYPMNPVCVNAPDSMYEELISFAKKYNIMVIHDNAYSDIIYRDEPGRSFLSFPGAKDVGAEFFSLSKSFNLTGARISFLVGNPQIVSSLRLLRSQIDFGLFPVVQKAAIAALTGPLDGVREQCLLYRERRDALCGGLRGIGWNVPDSEGTMFAWAPIPSHFSSSAQFCMQLMEQTGVITTPGSAFGSLGEGYVRFALTLPVPEIHRAIAAIQQSGILRETSGL